MHFVCRTCLQSGTNFLNLFNHFEDDKALSEILMECFAVIKVEEGDGLPYHVCNECRKKLNSAWAFRSLVLESESKLRNCGDVSASSPDSGLVKKEPCDCKNETVDASNSVYIDARNNNGNVSVEGQAQYSHSFVLLNGMLVLVSTPLDVVPMGKNALSGTGQQNALTPVEDVKGNLRGTVGVCCEQSIRKNCDNFNRKEINMESNEGREFNGLIYRDNIMVNEEIGKEHCLTGAGNASDNLHYENSNDLRKYSNNHFLELNTLNTELPTDLDSETTFRYRDVTNSNVIPNDAIFVDNSPSTSEGGNTDSKVSLRLPKKGSRRKEIVNKDNKSMPMVDKRGRPVGVPGPKIRCKVCHKLVSLSYYHTEHIHKHTDGFLCKICNKTFHSEYLLKTHQAVHQNQRHVCDICEEGFETYYRLLRHRRSHKGQLYPCPVCKKSFRRKNVLQQHVQRHSVDKREKTFICELCGKSFPALLNLKVHYESHNTEKTVPCPKCGKLFSNHRKVTAHLIWHNADCPYVCEYCNKGFKTQMSKKRHVLIHTGEKPHACKICDKRFTDGGTLSRHMLTHTGETPFACDNCPYKCKYKQQFDKHSKKHK